MLEHTDGLCHASTWEREREMGYVRVLAKPITVALLAAAGIYVTVRTRTEGSLLDQTDEAAIAAPSATPMTLLHPSGSESRNLHVAAAAANIFFWKTAARDTTGLLKNDPDAASSASRRDAAAAVRSRSTIVDVVVEGAEEEKPLRSLRRAGAIRRRARYVARETISRVTEYWRSSERARQISWDVVDACASHCLGDMPRSNIIPRVLYSTLKREGQNWWRRHQRPQPRQGPPSPAQNGKLDSALPQTSARGSGGDEAGELKGLLMEMRQLRAEVRELRREVDQVKAQVGGTKLREEELPESATAGPVESWKPPIAEWENLLSKAFEASKGAISPPAPEVADAMEKLGFWETESEAKSVDSSATDEKT